MYIMLEKMYNGLNKNIIRKMKGKEKGKIKGKNNEMRKLAQFVKDHSLTTLNTQQGPKEYEV